MWKQRLIPFICLLVAIGFYWASVHSGRPGYEFPQMIALGMIALSGTLTVLSLKPDNRAVPDAVEPLGLAVIWPTLLVMLGYAFLAPRLGFFISSFLAFLVIALLYSPDRLSFRRVITAVTVSGVFIAVLYVLFVILLRVQMPRGLIV